MIGLFYIFVSKVVGLVMMEYVGLMNRLMFLKVIIFWRLFLGLYELLKILYVMLCFDSRVELFMMLVVVMGIVVVVCVLIG